MPARPCSFCLCLQGGSVFADFDADGAGIVWLRRISFDGYGCCDAGSSVTRMSAADSRLLLQAVCESDFSSARIEEALRSYFRENRKVIWCDALAAHDLL